MGLFGSRHRGPDRPGLPPGFIVMMERFGRFEFDPQASTDDPGLIWSETQAPLLPFATADPTGFADAIRAAVAPVGGWAAFGGACTAWELLASDDRRGPAYEALLSAAAEFLRGSGVPPTNVKGYIWNHWVDRGGTADTWIPRIPTPSPSDAPISPLQYGELRRIAQLSPRPDSNVVLVRLDPNGSHVAIIDARRSDDDPRRTQWDWKSAASSHVLYAAIALDLQMPPYWCDPELEPYFPLQPPLI
jgi:hypothetical protein